MRTDGDIRSHKAAAVSAGLLLAAALLALAAVFMWWNANPSPAGDGDYTVDGDGFPDVDWAYWQEVNPDVIGWVTVPGTRIDYPICQAHGEDPDYYLSHDVYGNANPVGVPYLDADCADEGLMGSRNAVVFGHHWTNTGAMFTDFAEFSDGPYATEHRTILVQTPDSKVKYNADIVQIVKGSSAKYTSFRTQGEYLQWYRQQVDNATVYLAADSQPETNITFVTCSYHFWAKASNGERTLVTSSPRSVTKGVFPTFVGTTEG